MFDAATITQLAQQSKEPRWLTQLRSQALARHAQLPWPHPSDDIWRRTDVSLLDISQGFSLSAPALLESVSLTDAQLNELTHPLGQEQLAVRLNGAWLTGGEYREVTLHELSRAAAEQPDVVRPILEADGLTEAEQKLSTLNGAFHHDDLWLEVPPGVSVPSEEPLRLVHVFSASAKQALFPLTVITVGAGSSVTLIDEYVSLDGSAEAQPHLINGRVELLLEPEARAHYVRVQRWSDNAREFSLQRATLARGASLTMANIHLGAALSKAHVITRLRGQGASTKLFGFVFGHGAQHIDQHTLQDHQAPQTSSDLQFKAALRDESRMIYTGLIRIAKAAARTEAFQANHNLLLSHSAKAETIPMLEILADNVQCKHGASVGPIDDEQVFYLMSRGIPRAAAERLVVMGFIEPIMQQVPFEPLRERLRHVIESELVGPQRAGRT